MHEKYKIFFYSGEQLGLKSRALRGEAWVDEFGLTVKETDDHHIRIAKADIQKVTMFRLHGLGRVIQIDHRDGRLFISAIRFMIGQFASINFFRTGKLHRSLSGLLASRVP